MRHKWLREHWAIATLLVVFGLAKIPSLTMPFWWDEAGAYIPPSLEVAARGLRSALPGLHPKGLLSGHPPVLYLLHGSLYQWLGAAIFPHRLAAIAFALIGLWFTYRLGSLLCGRSTGLCAALLLGCSAMFFAQSTMVLGDLPITSLGVMSAYYFFKRERLAYMISATLLLQTKETALAIAVAAALYDFFFMREKSRGWRHIFMHTVPIGSLAAFFGIEYLATGTFVQSSYFSTGPLFVVDFRDPAHGLGSIFSQALWVARVLFWGEGRFLLTGMLLIGVVVWHKFWKHEFRFFGLVLAFYWSAFSVIGFLPRYVMPVLPLLCIAAAWSVYVAFSSRNAQYAAVCVASLVFLPFFYMNSESGSFETNLQHREAVAVSERVAEFVDAKFTAGKILVDFPFTAYLRIPELGYVKKPRIVVEASAIRDDELPSIDWFIYFSVGQSALSDAMLQKATRPPLRRFEAGDRIFAEIYDLHH